MPAAAGTGGAVTREKVADGAGFAARSSFVVQQIGTTRRAYRLASGSYLQADGATVRHGRDRGRAVFVLG